MIRINADHDKLSLSYLRAAGRRCVLRRLPLDRRPSLSRSEFPVDAIQLVLQIQLKVKLLRSWASKHCITGGNVEEHHDRRLDDIENKRINKCATAKDQP